MKLGILFEMATCEKTGRKYKLSEFKSPHIDLPFDGIFMHQCPQKSQHAWPWGDDVYISPRTGIWLSKPDNIIAFRLKSYEIYGEPRKIYDKKAKRVLETPKDLASLEWK